MEHLLFSRPSSLLHRSSSGSKHGDNDELFYSTSMLITGTEVLSECVEKEDRMCPIEMEEFDSTQVVAGSCMEFVPAGTCFVEGRPDLCVATLKECGHRFRPMAIVYHMCLTGMQCPVCR